MIISSCLEVVLLLGHNSTDFLEDKAYLVPIFENYFLYAKTRIVRKTGRTCLVSVLILFL